MRPPDDGQGEPASAAWAPLEDRLFRSIWIAALVSNVGTWMHDVSAGWLMTSMAPEPLLVSLVQSAASLPMFLLALPAGALADIVDRRRLLLAAQAWMLGAAAALAALAFLEAVTPLRLLVATFALGIGTAMNAPAWHAAVPELVPRRQLVNALVLNSAGVNLARAVGPALGGVVVASFGPAAAFALNALSFLAVIRSLYRWRRTPPAAHLPPERLFGAIRSGFRYVRRAPAFQAVIARAGLFLVCGSALWALLPLIARVELGSGPAGYGLLLGSLGAGAVTGALALPRLRGTVPVEGILVAATAAFALAAAWVARAPHLAVACATTFAAGGAWLILLSTLNVAAQTSVPGWVRARALAVYLVVFFGAMSGGSVAWGFVATLAGVPTALAIASVLMVTGLLVRRRFPVPEGEGADLAPDVHWPAPQVVGAIDLDRGPVLVTLDYRIDPARAAEFTRAMDDVRVIRERDGAILWGLFVDAADPARYVESFLVDSWVEHLRQHERTTVTDRAVLERARAFHVGEERPVVSHLIASE